MKQEQSLFKYQEYLPWFGKNKSGHCIVQRAEEQTAIYSIPLPPHLLLCQWAGSCCDRYSQSLVQKQNWSQSLTQKVIFHKLIIVSKKAFSLSLLNHLIKKKKLFMKLINLQVQLQRKNWRACPSVPFLLYLWHIVHRRHCLTLPFKLRAY